MTISNITHQVYDNESSCKAIDLIIDHLTPMLPKIKMSDINHVWVKYYSSSIEAQMNILNSCRIIEDYLGSLNIHFHFNSPSYLNDPNHGPYQIKMKFTKITPIKNFYYCPQFVNGNLRIDLKKFRLAMEVLAKPESILLLI